MPARRQEVLDFIGEHLNLSGVAPSTREIQAACGFASQTSVVQHLKALQKAGWLRVLGKARGLVLTAKSPSAPRAPRIIQIPLLGSIPAGMPQQGGEGMEGCLSVDADCLHIPHNMRTFALKVRGDSMTGAGILDGDNVVLEFREPRAGDVVAALIDGETTLKRYLLRSGQPYLHAENPRYPDLIPAQELVIQGVMVALLRITRDHGPTLQNSRSKSSPASPASSASYPGSSRPPRK